MKAFMVFSGDPTDGCQLIFADTANKAKYRCIGHLHDWEYVQMNCKRMPEFDEFAGKTKSPLVDDNNELPENAPNFYCENEI